MAYVVPNGQRGEGKRFISKQAYLKWASNEIKVERQPIKVYDGSSWMQRKMLGKTKTVGKTKWARGSDHYDSKGRRVAGRIV